MVMWAVYLLVSTESKIIQNKSREKKMSPREYGRQKVLLREYGKNEKNLLIFVKIFILKSGMNLCRTKLLGRQIG